MSSIAPSAPLAPPAPRPRIVLRHHWLVRLTHWLNALAIITLLMTGLNIFGAHPRLYWGNAGSVDQRERVWLEIGASPPWRQPSGWLDVNGTRIPTTGLLGVSKTPSGGTNVVAFPHWATLPAMRDLATARTWHFFAAWALILNGLAWLLYGLLSGRLWREILPSARQLAPGHLWHDIVEHARLRFPKGEAALSYEVLQRLAYAGVTLVLIPTVILTGLAMSPGMDAAWPWLDQLWGGRQSARSVHFLAMAGIAGFLILHLVLVILSGPIRQIGAMITGRMTVGGDK
ncbi:cytochrome b/b6 domain-containing protein [Sandarakinorhabdus oryzae]|uniref:cytochrome b/b6 domain-containing protein n=1 Tax=Sandarakinorhabdus oryzae TaxID=2675220 RepID=UPI0012E24432|nr:cytochrome b/b6 domain-containing protein [Sandarakinorhabdus oryzae]